jgi:hypothetical protein
MCDRYTLTNGVQVLEGPGAVVDAISLHFFDFVDGSVSPFMGIYVLHRLVRTFVLRVAPLCVSYALPCSRISNRVRAMLGTIATRSLVNASISIASRDFRQCAA